MIFWILALSILGLVALNGVTYWKAPGTVAQRLAACASGSLTLFIGIWGTILTGLTFGLDALAELTGDPQFTQFADAIKSVIPEAYHPWIPVAAMTATMLARLRTLKPSP